MTVEKACAITPPKFRACSAPGSASLEQSENCLKDKENNLCAALTLDIFFKSF